MHILAILFMRGGGVVQAHKAERLGYGQQGGRYPRCKGTILQPNRVESCWALI